MNSDGDIDYEMVGEVFTALVGLFKMKSKIFATNIGKQVRNFTAAIMCTYWSLGIDMT